MRNVRLLVATTSHSVLTIDKYEDGDAISRSMRGTCTFSTTSKLLFACTHVAGFDLWRVQTKMAEHEANLVNLFAVVRQIHITTMSFLLRLRRLDFSFCSGLTK